MANDSHLGDRAGGLCILPESGATLQSLRKEQKVYSSSLPCNLNILRLSLLIVVLRSVPQPFAYFGFVEKIKRKRKTFGYIARQFY